MSEAHSKEDLIEDIVNSIESDGTFPEYSKIQLEAICDRYIVVNEDNNFSTIVIKNDASKGLSVSAGHIFFQFKNSMKDIYAIASDFLGLSNEKTVQNIMIVVDIIKRIFKVTTITIDAGKCKILLGLHQLNAYDKLYSIQTIGKVIKNLGFEEIPEDELRMALADLSDIGCIRIDEQREEYGLVEIVCYPKRKIG